MKASVAMLAVSLIPLLTTGGLGCHVGERLRDTAQQRWFNASEVQGFLVPSGLNEMCFFADIGFDPDELKCQKTSRFLDCGQNCRQHKMNETVLQLNSTTRLVNFRMLPPDAALDKAYVIRVYNDTLVYIVQGHCNRNDSLYELWPPIRLLQRPDLLNSSKSCANCSTPTTDTCNGDILLIFTTLLALIVVLLLVLLMISFTVKRSATWNTGSSPSEGTHRTTHTQTGTGNATNNTSERRGTEPSPNTEAHNKAIKPSGDSSASVDSGTERSPPLSTVTSSSTLPDDSFPKSN